MKWTRRPNSVYCGLLVLEVDSQTEFQLPRPVGLIGDPAKRRWTGQSQTRVGWLEVVQDVGELKHEGGANPLPELEVLGDRRIEVPAVLLDLRELAGESGVSRVAASGYPGMLLSWRSSVASSR